MSAPRPPRSLTSVVVRGVGLAGAGYALSSAFTFVIYLVLARLASPRDFGQFAAGTIVAGVGTLLAESGMLAAIIQRRDRVEEAANTGLVSTLLGGLAMSLLALAAAPLIGHFFSSHQVTLIAAAMSGWLLLRLASVVPDAMMQRRFSFLRRVVAEPVSAVAFGIGSIIAAAYGLGAWSLVIGTYAAESTQLIGSWALAQWRPRPRLASFAMWRELAGFGRFVIAGEFIRRLGGEVPNLLLGRFVGTGAIGQYRYATRVGTTPLGLIINAGAYVLLPAFARVSTDEARFRSAFLRALRWYCVVALPTSLIFLPLGVPIMVVVFGPQWRDAGYALMALCIYGASTSFGSIASEAWKAAGRPDMLPRMHTLSVLISAALMGALLPFGVVGVAGGMALGSVGVAGYALRGAGRVVDIPVMRMLRDVWPPTVASLAMVAVVFPLERFALHADQHGVGLGVVLLGCEGIVALVVYVGVLAALAPNILREMTDGVRSLRRARRSQPPADGESPAAAPAPELALAAPERSADE